jgi:hypothetical protein
MVSCSLEAKKLTFDFENLNLECIPVIERGIRMLLLFCRDYKSVVCWALGRFSSTLAHD